jgi:lysozyme
MNRKAIFDRVKAMLGRGYTTAEVAALDAAIDSAMLPDAPSVPEQSLTPRGIGPTGLGLIKQFEGCAKRLPDGRYTAYPDPGTGGEPWTIGWGATGSDGAGGRIRRGLIWTQAECDARLMADLPNYSGAVVRALGSAIDRTSQAQFDALVSFHYNTGAIARATLTAKHKAGDFKAAEAEFARWVRAGGNVLPGLVRRRAAEAALYRSGSS